MGFTENLILSWLKVPPEPEEGFGRQASLMVFRASPQYFKYKLFSWVIGTIISTVFVLFGGGAAFIAFLVAGEFGPTWSFILSALAILIVLLYLLFVYFSYVILKLDYEMRWYKLTDRSIRIREGIWFVREMTMTNANIQNIEINQNPFERYFGISNLMVQTAGGGSGMQQEASQGNQVLFDMHKGYFRGVDNAEEIRKILRDRLNKLKDSGLGDQDDASPEAPQLEAIAAGYSPQVVECATDVWREAHEYRKTLEKLLQRLS
ncbi:MAG: PH domain-containing protein [Sumerlaeia bacterium]